MPNYQEMYLKLFRATERAMDMLIAAQRECEKLYISPSGEEQRIIPLHNMKDSKTGDE